MSDKSIVKFKEQILEILKANPGAPVSRKQLSRDLHVRKNQYHLFQDSLLQLVDEKVIAHAKGHSYVFQEKARRMTGELRVTRSGFGFVSIEGQDADVFVAQPNLNTAFDRDTVEVQLYMNARGRRLEGFVKRVVKRFREELVGVYHKTDFYSYVTPDDPKINVDILVPEPKALQALDGQKALVRIEKWERQQHNPEGEIVRVLGFPDDPGVDMMSVAHSFNLPMQFHADLENDAAKIDSEIRPEEINGREDLRSLVCFTIDPVDAKDFDDAVSLTPLPNGNRELGVHIADVSHYVTEGSAVDKEALRRGTSVYMADRVIPMLPERLSNHLCSLQPDKDRLTYSCFMELDADLEVVRYRVVTSVIRSKKRFTYEEVQEILDGQAESPFAETLRNMEKLRAGLTAKRFETGGIDFETPEVRFILDEKGKPLQIVPKKRLNSHRLVEEFMLMANQTVAIHVKKISPPRAGLLPFLYRIHEKPDDQKMSKFFDFLTALEVKYKPSKRITSKYLQSLLESIKGTKEELIIEEVALRSMMKAIYSGTNIGHFGLGFKDYTHFTSPIRRYPDLTVHRLLKQYHKSTAATDGGLKEKLQKIAQQSTRMERLAMEAERESIKIKQAEYIRQHIGQNFRGIVSGVMQFGVFVELEETFVEGLIPITEISDDLYIYDEATYSLVGRESDKVIRLGDEVLVQVVNVDIEKRSIDFGLIENYSDEPGRNRRLKPVLKEETARPDHRRRRRRPQK
jgi:ribonuclease R